MKLLLEQWGKTPKSLKLKHHCDSQHGGKFVKDCAACRELSK